MNFDKSITYCDPILFLLDFSQKCDILRNSQTSLAKNGLADLNVYLLLVHQIRPSRAVIMRITRFSKESLKSRSVLITWMRAMILACVSKFVATRVIIWKPGPGRAFVYKDLPQSRRGDAPTLQKEFGNCEIRRERRLLQRVARQPLSSSDQATAGKSPNCKDASRAYNSLLLISS